VRKKYYSLIEKLWFISQVNRTLGSAALKQERPLDLLISYGLITKQRQDDQLQKPLVE